MSIVLIVDDDATARETLIAMLEGENYQLELATNGPEAIQMADQLHPDLILLDVMMPGMNGYEVCRRMRTTPQLAEVPIILLTALDDRSALLQGIQAGADDFLTKPLDRTELSARVRTITRLNRYHILMDQREQLRQVAERVVVAQEQERRRISRDLHDDLGQALTTHLISLRNLQDDLSIPEKTLFEQLQALYDQSLDVFVKIRTLAHDLRPPVLDALGLKLAMETYCTEFSRRTHLPVSFEADASLPLLPDIYNITLYRVLQEALTNVIKHSQATQAWVELSVEDQMIALTVQDNGRGFAEGEPQSNGIGLTGLRERLTIAGGTLAINSSPKRGTILSIQVPLSNGPAVQGES